jgi:hypothetical protein
MYIQLFDFRCSRQLWVILDMHSWIFVYLRFGDEDSISTETAECSFAYISMMEPKSFIVEMTWNRKVRDDFVAALRSVCPLYALFVFTMNSSAVSMTSRTRFYIVGIHVLKAG